MVGALVWKTRVGNGTGVQFPLLPPRKEIVMGPELVWTFLWVSTAIGVWCLVMTLTFIACGGLFKKFLFRWIKKKVPPLKEFIMCMKSGDDEGAIIAMEQLVGIAEDNI